MSQLVLPDTIVTFGWREWVGLPELGLAQIKAKVDTGARTSTLHAFEVRPFFEDNVHRVEFKIHPRQRNSDIVETCVADVLDERVVTDSGGHKEQRLVVVTPIVIGPYSWPIEMTLTSRDNMLFRMLLGRTAIEGIAVVDPAKSYLVGRKPRKKKTAA
jgi:hypothetical protein